MTTNNRDLQMKTILGLKFMKKTKERIEKEQANTHDHENLYSNLITDEMRHASEHFITVSSIIHCVDLMEGRMSFNGMNPEIERLMELENKKNEIDGEMEKDVSDKMLIDKMDVLRKRKSTDDPNKHKLSKKRKYTRS